MYPHSHRPILEGEFKMIIIPKLGIIDCEESKRNAIHKCMMEAYSEFWNATFERSTIGTYTIYALFFNQSDEFQLNIYDRHGYLKAVLRDDWAKIGPLDGEGSNLVNRLAQTFYRK